MKARSWLIFPLLLGSIAVAARCLPTEEAEKGAEWEKDRVDRPPVKASFVPAPGFLVISGHSRQWKDANCLDIYRGQEHYYHLESRGLRLHVGEAGAQSGDLNGDGVPEFVVVEELGEWQSVTHILSLGQSCRELVRLKSVFGPRFSRDQNGRLLASVNDSTFSCWRYSHAMSPHPEVVLRLNGAIFELASEFMLKTPPHDIEQRLAELQSLDEPGSCARLTALMVNLLYTGHPDLCLEAIRRTRLSPREKSDFLCDFRAELRKSPWAASLDQGLTKFSNEATLSKS